MITNSVNWIVGLMNSVGYLGIMLSVFLETVFPVLPSAFIQPFAGFVSSRSDQTLFLTILFAVLGAYLGTLPYYFLGLWGEKAVNDFLKKYGKYLFIDQDEVKKGFEFFDKYGNSIVFTGRLIPLVRSVISFPAGVAKMPFGQFTFYTLLGSAIWSTGLSVAGYLLGERWEIISNLLERYESLTIVLICLSIVGYVLYGLLKKRMVKS
jgi:membrane protein DedA with SNARE-associated domain